MCLPALKKTQCPITSKVKKYLLICHYKMKSKNLWLFLGNQYDLYAFFYQKKKKKRLCCVRMTLPERN